jgi:signal transduction histidine kinase
MKELLDYGRPHPLSLTPGNLGDVITESIRAVQPLADAAAVRVEMQPSNEPPPILRDRDRMIQVFNNLIENAVQHTPRDGSISISLGEVRADDGTWVECIVRDTGRGFVPDEMQRVFEPFYTRRRGGTGLGLSIVRRIVEGHGGRIEASNHPQGGAVMRVTFPATGVAQPVH